MYSFKYLLPFVALNLLFSFNLSGQDYNSDQLMSWSKTKVRDYCWKEHKYTKSQEESCPEEWKEQSAIFLRYEEKYEVTYEAPKSSYAASRVNVSFLGHYRVKILDEAALEKFSEVYYVKGAHGGYNLDDLGERDEENMHIKIIKPDGKEIIVNEKEIIEEEDGYRKVAIPNLEVGDVLDYILYTHDYSKSFYYGVIDQSTLNKRYPIKSFVYSVVTDNNWDVQFTSGEHALYLKEKKLKKNSFEFKLEEENVERIQSSRWNYYYQTGPYIRLYVAISLDNLQKRYIEGKQLHTSSLASEDIISKYRDYYQSDKSAANEYAAFKSYLKRKYGKEEVSNKKTLEELYYYMRHHFTNKHYVYDRYNGSGPNSFRKLTDVEFTGHIIFALKRMKVPYDIVVVVGRESGKIENVINPHQTDYLIRAKVDGEEIFFYQPSPYTRFNRFPYQIENAKGYIVEAENKRGSKLSTKTGALPVSKYKDNMSKFEIKVRFDSEDITLLKTSTKATHTGHQIENYQYDVVDWMQMIWDENELYKTKMWGHESRDKSEEMKNFVEAQADDRKENFEIAAEDFFDLGEDVELTDYETLTTANTSDEDNLQYTFDCDLSNLVKKVGPNYILKAGYLAGSQLTLDEDEKERDVDVHMNYPRSYDYTIDIEIPEGYEVKGLNNFENNVDNETGSLISAATLTGNTLTIKFKKYYKHSYVKAADWPKMVAFLEPGSDFLTKEILLKKKKN